MDNNTPYVTDTNKTPLIQIMTWFLLASAVVITLSRAYTKWVLISVTGLDDFVVPLALIFLAAESAAVTVQTTNGYGKPDADLSDHQLTTVLKAQYAAMLMYIPSLVLSKLPSLVLMSSILPSSQPRRLIVIIGISIIVWAVTSELAAAFQCRPDAAWNYLRGKCINRTAFLIYFEIMNALTDVLLIVPPVMMINRVQVRFQKKIPILVVFGVRLLPIAAILAKIILYLQSVKASDPFFATWPATICTQLIQFLELMAACILYVRPFLEALSSGFINGDDLRRRGELRPYALESAGLSVSSTSQSHRRGTVRREDNEENEEEVNLTKRGTLEL